MRPPLNDMATESSTSSAMQALTYSHGTTFIDHTTMHLSVCISEHRRTWVSTEKINFTPPIGFTLCLNESYCKCEAYFPWPAVHVTSFRSLRTARGVILSSYNLTPVCVIVWQLSRLTPYRTAANIKHMAPPLVKSRIIKVAITNLFRARFVHLFTCFKMYVVHCYSMAWLRIMKKHLVFWIYGEVQQRAFPVS